MKKKLRHFDILERLERNLKWKIKFFILYDDTIQRETEITEMSIYFSGSKEKYMMKLASEKDRSVCIEFSITNNLMIDWMDNNTISCYNKETLNGLAFSFQNEASANKAWKTLEEIIEQDSSEDTDSELNDGLLPDPSLSNLKLIKEKIGNSTIPLHEKIIYQCLEDEEFYLKQLFCLVDYAEKAKTKEALEQLFQIFKGLISWNCSQFILALASEKNFEKTLQVLEFGFSIYTHKPPLLKYFFRQSKFINVLGPLPNEITYKIFMNFRLTFLRDTAAVYWLEENTHNIITEIINLHNKKILGYFFDNEATIETLFKFIESTEIENKLNAICFLLELCACSRNFDTEKKSIFFYKLIKSEVFSVILNLLFSFNIGEEDAMASDASPEKESSCSESTQFFENTQKIEKAKINAVEIVRFISQAKTTEAQSALLSPKQEQNKFPLLFLFSYVMVNSTNDGVKFGIFDFIKRFLTEGINDFSTLFLNAFKIVVFPYFVNIIQELNVNEKENLGIQLVFDLLEECLNIYGIDLHQSIAESGLVKHVNSVLLKTTSKSLSLCCLKLIYSVIPNSQKYLQQYVSETSSFSGVFHVLVRNRLRDNMLTSVCNEIIMRLLLRESPKFIKAFCKPHLTVIHTLKKVYIFRKLRQYFENHKLNLSSKRNNSEPDSHSRKNDK